MLSYQEINVIELITEAFELYGASHLKNSSIKQYNKELTRFTSYVTEKGLLHERAALTQKGINDYQEYLKESGVGIGYINKLCGLIVRLINDILSIRNKYLHYELKEVRYVKLQDGRTKSRKDSNFPLNSDEVNNLANCQNLSQKEQEYNIIFLLQIETGLRVSDMKKLLAKDFEQEGNYIILTTTKNRNLSYIRMTDKVIELLDKTKHFKFIKDGKFDKQTYNRHIKAISRKAQLNRMYDWEDSKGIAHQDKICELMTSHNARHTFIQNMRNFGILNKDIALMTGHTDDQVLRKDYNKPSHQDHINRLNSVFDKSSRKTSKNTPIKPDPLKLIEELFALKEIFTLRDMDNCGVNIYDQPQLQTVYSKLKDTRLLSEAVTQFQNQPPKIEEWILDFVRKLCKAHYNTKAYNLFEYKLYRLGISKHEPLPEEMVGYWWECEDHADQQVLSDLPVELWNEYKR